MLAQIRRLLILRKLNASLKPAPEYRTRRLAALSPERRVRYLANIEAMGTDL